MRDLFVKLFDKNTKLGRGIRTALQVALALMTFLLGFTFIPGLSDLLANNGVITVASFATWTGIISYVQNALEDLWELVK